MKKLLLLATCALSLYSLKISANYDGCTYRFQACHCSTGQSGKCLNVFNGPLSCHCNL